MRQGWVYVMVNASMRNMVKVGRTTREPRLRVGELSSATGVPTPFTLQFQQAYADCERAEREIHHALDERGLRVNANREFFHGPARTIIRIIMAHADQEPRPPALRFGVLDGCVTGQAQAGFQREADHFGYAEIASHAALTGDAGECLRAWDLFFEAHMASGADPAGAAKGEGEAMPSNEFWADPRLIPACRRYVTCCLMLGTVPGHRPVLLRIADDMLDQQLADLQRVRGTQEAAPLSAVMRWIYENLEPEGPGDTGLPGADKAEAGCMARSEIAAA